MPVESHESTLLRLESHGGKVALIDATTQLQLSYSNISDNISKIQAELKKSLQLQNASECSIGISMPNCAEFVCCFLAITNLGLASAPLNPAYSSPELKFYLGDTKCRILLLLGRQFEQRESLESHPCFKVCKELGIQLWLVDCQNGGGVVIQRKLTGSKAELSVGPKMSWSGKPRPDSVALLLHTSGTTSAPKCVPLTHRNILRTCRNIAATYALSPDDRSLVVMPLFHVHGLIGALLSSLVKFSGGSAVVQPFSVTRHWPAFEQYECTWYSAVPTMHQLLLKQEESSVPARKRRIVPKLRFIRSCSSALAPVVLQRLREVYGVPVVEAYAMTEAAHQVTSNPLPPGIQKPGSVGLPQGVSMAILDISTGMPLKQGDQGEVCVRGENVTSGYLNREDANRDAFTKDGWFRTGDLGYLDNDGYLFLAGRLKEMINRGGEKISPLEIDAVLLEHTGVSEAISFGVPHPVYGEEVNAAVIPKQGHESMSEQQLKEFCSKKLAPFKIPKLIHITTTLPKTATGKVQRRKVAEHFLLKGKL